MKSKYTPTYRRACFTLALDNLNHAISALEIFQRLKHDNKTMGATNYANSVRLTIANISNMANWIIEVTK